jgi:DNA-binding NarL/FixJ family response regulator
MLLDYEPPVLTPTAREREILQLAAAGLTTADIGARLGISPATVKRHFQNVYPKLGARDRTSAVAGALRRCLIS